MIVVHGVKMWKKLYLMKSLGFNILLFSVINVGLAVMLVIHHH